MPRDLPTGTVTFLFTDIEGSTRLLQQLGPDVYAEALAEHRRVLRDAFAAEGGLEVDTQGDAFFVAFPTAAGAVAAATYGQQALAPGPITVRMGVHTGTPTVAAEGYVRIDVHRGARVAALAHGGQVIVSATTAALVGDEPLRDLGRHRLKDFDAPAQLFQLGTSEFPPLRTPGAVDLPIPATLFLGRERELLEAATQWLDRDPRVLTIIGPGGTGKTRFSIELAGFLSDEADGGTVFVPLAPVRDAALVVPLIAERLGASAGNAAAIATRIGEKQTHVVLDNLEQLLPDAARPLVDLLAAAPALRIVATSRESLRIAGESEFDLPPMDERDAVTLFMERAQAVRADVGDSPAVHELIRRLDGLPLAIELAAARVKLLGPRSSWSASRSDWTCSRAVATLTSTTPRCAPRSPGATTSSTAVNSGCSPGSQSSAAAALSRRPKQSVTRTSTRLRRSSTRASSAAAPTRTGTNASGCSRRSASSRGSTWRPRVRRMPCGDSRPTGCSSSPIGRARARLSVSPASGTSTSSRPSWTTCVPCSTGRWTASPGAASPWPRRSRDSGSSVSRPRAPPGSSLCSRKPRTRGRSFALTPSARSAVPSTSPATLDAAPFYRQSLELFMAIGDEIQTANLRYRVAGNMVNRGEQATDLAAARGITPHIPAARPASR